MLSAENITKRFGGLLAVSEASLVAERGRITSLIGPNGAGKTTLFAVMSGFMTPDDGIVTFEGERITGRAPHLICRDGLVRTFQIVRPFNGLTVVENIQVGAYARTAVAAEAAAKAREVCEFVGLGKYLDRLAASLPVAGRKRLELAKALATSPKCLLLDEVMAGLTPTEIEEIIPLIFRIRDGGATILLIEHVMQAVMRVSDYTYVLANGRMIAHGTPSQVVSDSNVIAAYLGPEAAARVAGAQTSKDAQ